MPVDVRVANADLDNPPGEQIGVFAGKKDTAGGSAPPSGPGETDDGASQRTKKGRTPYEIGHFVFLRADDAPFVVGKVLERKYSNEENDELIKLQWWSPSNNEIRRNASKYTAHEYGKGVFTADYVWEDVDGRKRRRVPDVGWEFSRDVVSSCGRLNNGGKRLPKDMLHAVSESQTRWLQDQGQT